jgi:hypothetical protein
LDFSGTYHLVRNLSEDSLDVPLDPQGGSSNESDLSHTASADDKDLIQIGILRLGLESLFSRIPSSLGVHHAPLILIGMIYLVRERKSANTIELVWIGLVSILLLLTLPDHRYFLPVFPAIAIAMARVLYRFPDYAERAIILTLLFQAGNLYLFANWVRESHLFLLTP